MYNMPRSHPHLGATYRVVRLADMTFGTEVRILGMCPTMIRGFATEAVAEAWIAKHEREISDYANAPRRRSPRLLGNPTRPKAHPASASETGNSNSRDRAVSGEA